MVLGQRESLSDESEFNNSPISYACVRAITDGMHSYRHVNALAETLNGLYQGRTHPPPGLVECGRPAGRSSWPRSIGSTGSTIVACLSPSDTSHPQKLRHTATRDLIA